MSQGAGCKLGWSSLPDGHRPWEHREHQQSPVSSSLSAAAVPASCSPEYLVVSAEIKYC